MKHWIGVACLAMASCASSSTPATISLGNDACAHCRMVVVSRETAAELVVPGEEPQFFDEIGCLREYLKAMTTLPPEAVIYVADHRTGEWVDARQAVFTRTAVDTPMGSGVIAHMNAESKAADPVTEGGTAVAAAELFAAVVWRTVP